MNPWDGNIEDNVLQYRPTEIIRVEKLLNQMSSEEITKIKEICEEKLNYFNDFQETKIDISTLDVLELEKTIDMCKKRIKETDWDKNC